MEFTVHIGDIRGRINRERMEVRFHNNGISFSDDGYVYYLDLSNNDLLFPSMLVSRSDFSIQVGNKFFNEGVRFVEETGAREDIIMTLDELKKYPSFRNACTRSINKYMENKRKEVYEKIYSYFTEENGIFGKKMLEEDGCEWAQMADPIMDMYLGYDENRKAIYIFIEYNGSSNEDWQKATYRAYFDELLYDSEIAKLQNDLAVLSDKMDSIIGKFNRNAPVNYYERDSFMLRPFKELFFEPLVMFFEEEGKPEASEVIRNVEIAGEIVKNLIEKKHLIIPANCLSLSGSNRVFFKNIEDITLEINSEDIIVDNGETVLMQNPSNPEESFDMNVYHLILSNEIRTLIRKHCPMVLDKIKKGKNAFGEFISNIEKLNQVEETEMLKPIPVKRGARKKNGRPSDNSGSDLHARDVNLLSMETDDIAIEGSINRLLDEGRIDELKEFMKKVGRTSEGLYFYLPE